MRSMTGYGRRMTARDGREMTVEVKTVNHRFLDVSCRLPRALSFAEDAVRKQLGASLRRGHADVNVTYVNLRQDVREVRLDEALVMQYREALLTARQIARKERSSVRDEDVAWIVSQPDVVQVTVKEEDQEAVLSLLGDTLAQALQDVVAMREKEGEALRRDLTVHLDAVASLRDEIASLAPGVPLAYREKLQQRIREMGVGGLDEQRLAQEVALMADRCAVDEELSRLESHIAQMRQAICAEGETGRRLDFLTQELNREANTIGSKASDAGITKLVVAMKGEIEKLREQVQNVE
ncbi:MAG: YicC family protein [Clostridia bacterium]|nr:YicC family protein [Clostridia bacterium]